MDPDYKKQTQFFLYNHDDNGLIPIWEAILENNEFRVNLILKMGYDISYSFIDNSNRFNNKYGKTPDILINHLSRLICDADNSKDIEFPLNLLQKLTKDKNIGREMIVCEDRYYGKSAFSLISESKWNYREDIQKFLNELVLNYVS
jgi:hypothetical protein